MAKHPTNDDRYWPLVLTLDEVAAILGVTPDAVRRRISSHRMFPKPFRGNRWWRPDLVQYLSDGDRVARDWGRARRKAERAEPTAIKTGDVEEPVTDLTQLPVILKLRDLAAVLRRSEAAIRKDVDAGQMVPPPIAKRQLRWTRFDLARYLEHAVRIEESLDSWRSREEGRKARERAALTGDPFKAAWRVNEAVEQLATTDAPLRERVAAVLQGALGRVRVEDVPLTLHREWRRLEEVRGQQIADIDPMAVATAITRLSFQFRAWVQTERPGVLV